MKTIRKVYFFLVFAFLYLPIFILVVFSFNSSKSRAVFSGFSFRWYERLLNDEDIILALLNTFFVAIVASLLAAITGTMAAIGVNRFKKTPRKIFLNLNSMSMVNPEIISGVSLMVLFVSLFKLVKLFKLGLLTLVLAHTTICIPTVVLSVLPKLYNMDPCLKYAAKDLGCTPIKAFFKVTFFYILPGIVSGALMSFTLSLDDFIISYFTGGTTQLLPVLIYSMTKKIISPEINALSSVLLFFVFILIIVVNFLNKKDSKNKKVKKTTLDL